MRTKTWAKLLQETKAWLYLHCMFILLINCLVDTSLLSVSCMFLRGNPVKIVNFHQIWKYLCNVIPCVKFMSGISAAGYLHAQKHCKQIGFSMYLTRSIIQNSNFIFSLLSDSTTENTKLVYIRHRNIKPECYMGIKRNKWKSRGETAA